MLNSDISSEYVPTKNKLLLSLLLVLHDILFVLNI